MNSSTTVLFIPGAWHSPECFDKVIQRLEADGYITDVVHLPSVGAIEPHSDFSKDVLQIRKQIEIAVNAEQRVVVVSHSYGGLPGCEAVCGLDWATRQRQNKPGGVVHLFFCCSFIVPEGKSLISSFGGDDLPWFQVSDDRLVVTPAKPRETFYNDMDELDAKAAAGALKPHSYQTFHSNITFAAWRHVPSTYLYCLRDEAIPLAVQKMMVQEVAKGVEIHTQVVDASHSPFYSAPDQVAAAIKAASLQS
ncbi:alpha/beta-hydrolase [Aspergillus costaricaensis CBS 115574]|uniref:Alpha/beta-hydrolase n=1 Tax=Aspergillus costaricaensis CBS 115574 TaxID=1448317 RepID=A0ACD1IBH3_9EURO|nr:alpha/beta-hydrolase [Aspergillus costaricaensis CBS 115574]RAK87821.1 alpha/beta-hydrolase [Aspergillus costaricaensis CBS 115574]